MSEKKRRNRIIEFFTKTFDMIGYAPWLYEDYFGHHNDDYAHYNVSYNDNEDNKDTEKAKLIFENVRDEILKNYIEPYCKDKVVILMADGGAQSIFLIEIFNEFINNFKKFIIMHYSHSTWSKKERDERIKSIIDAAENTEDTEILIFRNHKGVFKTNEKNEDNKYPIYVLLDKSKNIWEVHISYVPGISDSRKFPKSEKNMTNMQLTALRYYALQHFIKTRNIDDYVVVTANCMTDVVKKGLYSMVTGALNIHKHAVYTENIRNNGILDNVISPLTKTINLEEIQYVLDNYLYSYNVDYFLKDELKKNLGKNSYIIKNEIIPALNKIDVRFERKYLGFIKVFESIINVMNNYLENEIIPELEKNDIFRIETNNNGKNKIKIKFDSEYFNENLNMFFVLLLHTIIKHDKKYGDFYSILNVTDLKTLNGKKIANGLMLETINKKKNSNNGNENKKNKKGK